MKEKQEARRERVQLLFKNRSKGKKFVVDNFLAEKILVNPFINLYHYSTH